MSPKDLAMTKSGGKWFRISAIGLPLALVTGGIVIAQIEGPKRGINPIASNGDFEVTGVSVNVTGDNAQEARQKGWEEAQRLAWSALWRRTHGGASRRDVPRAHVPASLWTSTAHRPRDPRPKQEC